MTKHIRVFLFGCLPRIFFWVILTEIVVHTFIWSMIWSGAEPHFENYNQKAVSTCIFWMVSFVTVMIYYSDLHYKKQYGQK